MPYHPRQEIRRLRLAVVSSDTPKHNDRLLGPRTRLTSHPAFSAILVSSLLVEPLHPLPADMCVLVPVPHQARQHPARSPAENAITVLGHVIQDLSSALLTRS